MNTVQGATIRNFGSIPPVQAVTTASTVGSYDKSRFDAIRQALAVQGFDKLMSPSDVELSYVSSVFQSKNFNDIDAVTYQAISEIGKSEFDDLNKKMSSFLASLKGVELVGMCDLLGDLSKSVDQMDFKGVWEKALNAKPTLWARIIALFNNQAARKSRHSQLDKLKLQFSENGVKLDAKLKELESNLNDQKKKQEKSIKLMEDSFQTYYDAFIGLRKQFALIVYLEESFKSQLEAFRKQQNVQTDLVMNKKLTDYEERYVDIQNKRLILHKSLLQLPMIVEQNKNLSMVCRTLIKEIDSTLASSFPFIRSNITTIATAITAQKGMDSTQSAQELERNAFALAQEVTGNLAVTATTMAANARLADAENVKSLVEGMANLSDRLKVASTESQGKFDQATQVINEATDQLAQIMRD